MFLEILLIFLTIYLIVKYHVKPKGLPPGEWGLPFVGYLPFMMKGVNKTIKKLQEKHGRIFTLKLGSVTFVVLSDYTQIMSAFRKAEFSGRPSFHTFSISRKYGDLGILFSENNIWTTNRRFALKTLKDFGLGKSKLEEFIRFEAENLVTDFKKEVNRPYKIDWNLNVAILNVIWRLVADRRYDINDKEIKTFSQMVSDNLGDLSGPVALLNIFPNLIPLLPTFIKNTWMKEGKIRSKSEEVLAHISKIIDEHKKTFDPTHPRDYIDAYLIEKELQKNNPDYDHFGDKDLYVGVMDIFIAGSDTTSTTLRWFFLYMTKYQKVQKRVQEEIDRVLPRDKIPSLQDKQNLPCLEALTYEITRMISLVPFALPHGVTEDTTLDGYLIPKGTVAIAYAESVNRDGKYWKYPNKLSLENFLDEEGKFVPPKDGFMPFSIGRRQCVGEQLAKVELFLFMGAILQNFDITEPEGQSASLEPKDLITFIFNQPRDFSIVLKCRN